MNSIKFKISSQSKLMIESSNIDDNSKNNDEDKDDEDDEMKKIMGFGKFGSKKKINEEQGEKPQIEQQEQSLSINKTKSARKFDVDEMMGKFYEKLRTTKDVESNSDDDNDDENESKKETSIDNDDDDDDDFIGPPLPPGFEQENNDDNDDDDDDDDEYDQNDDNRYSILPISNDIELKHGQKSITALALDPNGSRLISGGIDYEIKFWDFGGMDQSLQSFRTIKPCQSHSIKHLEYSTNGELILVISGSCIAKLIDRNGLPKYETIKGDQYISDMNNTKGHVAMLNYGCWKQDDKNKFITCSNDGTCRLWDINLTLKKQLSLIRPRSQNGLRIQPNVCTFSTTKTISNDIITLGCDDGSIQLYDIRKSFINPIHLIRNAHQNSMDITSITYSYNGNWLATRSIDNTMKLWDTRMLMTTRPYHRNQLLPLNEWNNLLNNYSQTDCLFSPDDNYLLTSTSYDNDNNDNGKLLIYSTKTFDLIHHIDYDDSNDDEKNHISNIRTIWHPKLNQIITSYSNGLIKLYYDKNVSTNGALLCSYRKKAKKNDIFTIAKPTIITPHALPLFKQEKRKSPFVKMLKDRNDPVKSHRPDLPINGAGSGGRIALAGKTFASFIARNLGVRSKIGDGGNDEDPREALLRYAKDAEENPYWVTPAYQKNQPKPIFSETSTSEQNDDDDDEPKTKKHKPI